MGWQSPEEEKVRKERHERSLNYAKEKGVPHHRLRPWQKEGHKSLEEWKQRLDKFSVENEAKKEHQQPNWKEK